MDTNVLLVNFRQFEFQILVSVIFCWIVSLVVAGTFMISVPGPLQYLGFATFSAVQVLSFLFISNKYFKIQRIISTHYKRLRKTMGQDFFNQSVGDLDKEKSHNLTLMMLLSVFVIVWFPFMTILIIGTVYQAKGERTAGTWLQNGFVWTAILTYVNGAVNPFIYTIRYKEIGDEIRRQCRKIFNCSVGSSAAVRDANITNS